MFVGLVATSSCSKESVARGVPTEDGTALSRIGIEGYGIRLWLKSPFMVGRMPVGPKGVADEFAVAYEAAGRVQNLIVFPAVPRNPEGAQMHPVTMNTLSGYQLGDDGTRVVAGVDVRFEDLGTLEPGAFAPKWMVVSQSGRVDWPERTICKTVAAAPGYVFEKQP